MRFTCLLPVHAGDDADLFSRAFASVVANSLQPGRILICQDGALPSRLQEVVVRTGAEVVLHTGARGLHHNLNHALAQVTTPWFCRADADDINRPDRFAAQAAFLSDHPDVSVLGGSIEEVLHHGQRRLKAMPLAHVAIARRARWRNPINHMTAFVRTDALRACGGYPAIPRKEDFGLWLAMIARGCRFANLPDVLVEAHIGTGFHARRAGLHNLRSEYALYRLGTMTPTSAAIHIARAAALTSRTIAQGVYDGLLRR